MVLPTEEKRIDRVDQISLNQVNSGFGLGYSYIHYFDYFTNLYLKILLSFLIAFTGFHSIMED